MSHDPMHPNALGDGDGCRVCAIITRVREDERAQIAALAKRVEESQYAAALRDAVDAVVNCDDYPSGDNMLLVDAYRYGLEQARAAIEALAAQTAGAETDNPPSYDGQWERDLYGGAHDG